MLSNLILMNIIIITAESYVSLKNCQKEDYHFWLVNIPLVAYCIEFIGDTIVLALFGVMLNYFITKIKTSRDEAGIKFTRFNWFVVLFSWCLVISGFLTSISYILYVLYDYLKPSEVKEFTKEFYIAEIVVFRVIWPIKDTATSIFLTYMFYTQSNKNQKSQK